MGRARVRLKLGAIAYASARHGIDAEVGFTRAALAILQQASLEYYKGLTGTDLKGLRPSGDAYSLRAAAVAYVNSRHGVDGEAGLARAGMALLAAAAIDYCETLTGNPRPAKDRPIDPQLHDGG
jgi:hypothetical protein